MKYIFALLILVGGVLGVVGLVVLSCMAIEMVQTWEHEMECKYRKYYVFKVVLNDKILPWTFEILMISLFVFILTIVYLTILKML